MKTKDEDALRDACLKFDGDAVLAWVKENYNPSDLFREWARLNGWVKEGGAP